MEPIEIMGVAAAAIQFAQAGIAITKVLYSTISSLKSSAEVQRERLRRVSQLEALFSTIIPHPSFQTDAVRVELENCLHDATRLSDLLNRLSISPTTSKWRTWSKRVHALLKDDEIERCLAVLNRDKGSLALALQTADSQLLSNLGVEVKSIHGHVLDMSMVMDKIAQGVESTNKALPQVLNKLEKLEVTAGPQPEKKAPARFINVPYHRVKDFVGRTEDLMALKRHLLDEAQKTETRCVALKGLPGQGKTSLAIEYCRQYIDQPYQSILWIDASSHSTVDYDLTVCAEGVLSHDDGRLPLTLEGKAQAVFRHLTDAGAPWLIVFDNVDKPDIMLKLKRCFPVAQNASVLVTTRRQNVQDFLRLDGSVTIENMKEEDAVELLLHASKRDGTKKKEPRSRWAARSIVSQLWMNPLAIVQAGLYTHRLRLDFVDLLELCKDQSEILSDRLVATDYITKLEGPEMAQVLSICTIWDLSLRQVKNAEGDGPRAHKDDLLNILAFRPSSSFSESCFVQFCSTMRPWDTKDKMAEQPGAFLAACLPGWDSRAFGDILAELYDAGLILQYDVGKDGFYHGVMHGMVQDVARLRLAQPTRNEYEELQLDLVLHSGESTSAVGPLDKDVSYETTGDWLSDVRGLVESWAMPPWAEQVARLILDMASSDIGDGFPEFHDNRDFAAAVEELSSEVSMLAHEPRALGAGEKLVDKIMGVAQFAAGVDENVDDLIDAVLSTKAHEVPRSWFCKVLELLLPVLKQSGVFGNRLVDHVQHVGWILSVHDLWTVRVQGNQLLKAILTLRASEDVQGEGISDMAMTLDVLGQAFWRTRDWKTADIIFKARLDLAKAEREDPLEISKAMCTYGANLMSLEGRGRDALSTLKVAAGGLAATRGEWDMRIFCDMALAECSYEMGLTNEALGIATKALRDIQEFHDVTDGGHQFKEEERGLQCVRLRCLSILGYSSEAAEGMKKVIASGQERDLEGRYRLGLEEKYGLGVELGIMLLQAQRFGEAEAAAREAIRGFSSLGYPESHIQIQRAYRVVRDAWGHLDGKR